MVNTMLCENCTFILNNFKNVCGKCDFARCYQDRNGNVYFIRPGKTTKKFKIFFVRQCSKKQYEYENALYYFTFAEAQSELNSIAIKNKWKVYEGKSPANWSVIV